MKKDYDDDDDDDDDDEEEEDEGPEFRETPTGRTYVHKQCGGHTHVSEGDFTHICDPFWPCTGTFCCECAGMVSLSEVRWADTGEPISAYRSRLRSETPIAVKAWRFGGGLLVGLIPGAIVGYLIALLTQNASQKGLTFALVGGLVGGGLIYAIGTLILNLIFGIDYRRKR